MAGDYYPRQALAHEAVSQVDLPRGKPLRRADAMKPQVTTIEEARDFVFDVKICAVLSGERQGLPSLWDAVDLPEKQPGEKGWGKKMTAVWTWKTQLPVLYPDEIFYGKIRGGTAVLMSMDYLREKHYAENFRDIHDCSRLAQNVFELIRLDRRGTTDLRRESIGRFGCSKGQFASALKELQITMNVVRSNEPDATCDIWVPFREVYD